MSHASSTANNALVVSTTTATATTAGATIVTAINEYAVVIGLGLSLVSVLIGLFFHIYNIRWKKQHAEKQHELEKEKIREEVLKELSENNKEILSKMDK